MIDYVAVYADKLLAESNRDHLQKECDRLVVKLSELKVDDERWYETYNELIKGTPLEFTDYNVKYHLQEFDMETSLDYLKQAKHNLFETFLAVSDEFDGTDYMQGKKDGLRLAMAVMGDPEWLDFNRGNSRSRNSYGKKQED
jgi:hypothetical protein